MGHEYDCPIEVPVQCGVIVFFGRCILPTKPTMSYPILKQTLGRVKIMAPETIHDRNEPYHDGSKEEEIP